MNIIVNNAKSVDMGKDIGQLGELVCNVSS